MDPRVTRVYRQVFRVEPVNPAQRAALENYREYLMREVR